MHQSTDVDAHVHAKAVLDLKTDEIKVVITHVYLLYLTKVKAIPQIVEKHINDDIRRFIQSDDRANQAALERVWPGAILQWQDNGFTVRRYRNDSTPCHDVAIMHYRIDAMIELATIDDPLLRDANIVCTVALDSTLDKMQQLHYDQLKMRRLKSAMLSASGLAMAGLTASIVSGLGVYGYWETDNQPLLIGLMCCLVVAMLITVTNTVAYVTKLISRRKLDQSAKQLQREIVAVMMNDGSM